MNPLLKTPSSDFAGIRDGRNSLPLYIDIDLTSARSINANSHLVLNIAGNSFFVDADVINGGSGIVHFQDTNLGNSSAPFYVAPGFIANVGFTQLLIENAAQAGKRMRIFYGVDIDFQAGVTSSTNTNISNSLPASKIPVYQAGLDYASSFKSVAAMAANTPETIFTPAANVNGAIIHAGNFSASAVNNTTGTTFLAKAGAPANNTDGDVIITASSGFSVSTTVITYGCLLQPIKIAAGKGLYAICTIAEATAFRSALYTFL